MAEREKTIGYFKTCWWNEKQVNKRLLELMAAKDKTIEVLKQRLAQLEGQEGGQDGN